MFAQIVQSNSHLQKEGIIVEIVAESFGESM